MKTKSTCFSLITILLMGFTVKLTATNRYVSVNGDGNGLSWATAKGSIQSTLWDCSAGDTVFVSSGTYNEGFSIVDGVSVLGGYNALTGQRDRKTYETILDGSGLEQSLVVANCILPTLIEGLTLQNAVHLNNGGGACISGNITLSQCTIRNCKGDKGGGVYINANAIVRNCLIELCSAIDSGGAILNKGGLIENTIIRGNQGKYGAVCNDAGTVRNCVIYNNSASVNDWPDTGGIYNPGGSVENCIVTCNYGSQYAALHSEATTINTVCWNNQTEPGFAEPVAYIADTSSFSGHNAADDGVDEAQDAFVLSANNTAITGPNFKAPTYFSGVPATTAEIVAMQAADWTFTSSSPCIDKGTAIGVPAYDLTGTVRPKGNGYDLGAYEYNPHATAVRTTSVCLYPDSLIIKEDEHCWLAAVVLPADATHKEMFWQSQNVQIATVKDGLVIGVSVGETQVVVTTLDGQFRDTCVITVIAKPIVIIHPDVLAADSLNMADYTVPSWTRMLVAKEAACADSSIVNLDNLRNAVDVLVNKNMPYNIVANINGDPKSQMAFAWFTNAGITAGQVQLVAKANATKTDFASPTLVLEATPTAVNNLNYAVSTSGILKTAAMPVGTKRSYTSHKALATNLTAGTVYSYRVGQNGYWSEIRSFTTAATDEKSFKFLYMTDSHIMNAEYVENARRAAATATAHAADAKFLLFTGDFIETGTAQNSEWEWEQWFDVSMAPLLAKLPVAPTDGNHDDSENLNYTHHFNTDNSFNQIARVKPQLDGVTYSFVYGDALFLVYSEQDFWRGDYNYTAGTSTYLSDDVAKWFRAQVAAHPDTKWRIAAVHQNLFTGSGHQADTDATLFRAALLLVFAELDIDFVIQGHDHIYEVIGPVDNLTKTVVPNSVSDVQSVAVDNTKNPRGQAGGTYDVTDGTLYFVNGTCGRKRYYPYTQEQMEAKESAHQVPNYWSLFTGKYGQPEAPTFSEITVSCDTITVDTYTADAASQATLFDSYQIVKKNNKR